MPQSIVKLNEIYGKLINAIKHAGPARAHNWYTYYYSTSNTITIVTTRLILLLLLLLQQYMLQHMVKLNEI